MTTFNHMNRATMRQLAAAIAFIMMVSSVPAIGFVTVSGPSGPCFTLDLCHPIQSLERSPGTLTIARPAPPKLASENVSREISYQFTLILKGKFVKKLDPPPPKFIS